MNGVVLNRFRTKFGAKLETDTVTLNINTEVVQLKAEHNFPKSTVGSQGTPKSANVVLRIADKEKGEGVSCAE